jgi:hypothetical protein
MGAYPRNLDWTDQGPRGGCASIAFRNGSVGFFPLPRKAAFLAGQKSRLPPSSAMLWA